MSQSRVQSILYLRSTLTTGFEGTSLIALSCGMQKDDLVCIRHMNDTARLAVSKVIGITRSDYDVYENLRLALTHLIQTLGEAAHKVSAESREAYPDIP
jgi:hypothetical protein